MTTPGRSWSPERIITSIGIALSLVGAVLIPLVAGDDRELELILGVSTFVAGYVTTMDLAQRARLQAIENRVMDRLGAVEEARFGALPLQGLLSVPEIEEPIRDIVEAAARARSKHMQFLANRTVAKIRDDRAETVRISQGVFACRDRREELRLLRLALEDTRQDVKAVASLGLVEWKKDAFIEYFDTYLDFARRVFQSRVFLVTDEEARDPAMIEILERHEAAGVATYALNKDRVGADQSHPLVVFDDSLLLVHRSRTADGLLEVAFTDDAVRIRDALESYDALLAAARRRRPGVVHWAPATEEGTPAVRSIP